MKSLTEQVHEYICKNDTQFSSEELANMVRYFTQEQAKEIEQLKADLNIEKECYDKIEKHNLYLKNTHKHLRAIVIEKNKEIEQLKKQINLLVVSREPKIGDRVILLDDESEGVIESLSIAGGPRINFDDGCYGNYTRFELISLFAYKESE